MSPPALLFEESFPFFLSEVRTGNILSVEGAHGSLCNISPSFEQELYALLVPFEELQHELFWMSPKLVYVFRTLRHVILQSADWLEG